MKKEALPLSEKDLSELALKVKSNLIKEFGNKRAVEFLSTNMDIMPRLLFHTFNETRLKILKDAV
jgi:hypothetical protein